ncbi:hypothetical protein BpHYR1_019336 [Brachionus plicatilis]|uniref:Uncharacterized protein n=1 Tax=Brachionus plicatilis TaxID=10195 RepID=A0A3M7QGR4_BRAPC|nr:hypothetical protein BpHYR1_019336 [Brachionus plicatilis]
MTQPKRAKLDDIGDIQFLETMAIITGSFMIPALKRLSGGSRFFNIINKEINELERKISALKDDLNNYQEKVNCLIEKTSLTNELNDKNEEIIILNSQIEEFQKLIAQEDFSKNEDPIVGTYKSSGSANGRSNHRKRNSNTIEQIQRTANQKK